MLPLYEAKMVDFFDHRVADVVKSETAVNRQNQPRYLTVEERRIPSGRLSPVYWIAEDGPIPSAGTARTSKFLACLERLAELELGSRVAVRLV